MSRLRQVPQPNTSQALNPLEQSNCHTIKDVLGLFAEFARDTNAKFSDLYSEIEETSAKTYELGRRLTNIKRASNQADVFSNLQREADRLATVQNQLKEYAKNKHLPTPQAKAEAAPLTSSVAQLSKQRSLTATALASLFTKKQVLRLSQPNSTALVRASQDLPVETLNKLAFRPLSAHADSELKASLSQPADKKGTRKPALEQVPEEAAQRASGAEGKEVPLLEWGTAEEAAAAAAATQGQQTPTREQQAQQQAEILLDQVDDPKRAALHRRTISVNTRPLSAQPRSPSPSGHKHSTSGNAPLDSDQHLRQFVAGTATQGPLALARSTASPLLPQQSSAAALAAAAVAADMSTAWHKQAAQARGAQLPHTLPHNPGTMMDNQDAALRHFYEQTEQARMQASNMVAELRAWDSEANLSTAAGTPRRPSSAGSQHQQQAHLQPGYPAAQQQQYQQQHYQQQLPRQGPLAQGPYQQQGQPAYRHHVTADDVMAGLQAPQHVSGMPRASDPGFRRSASGAPPTGPAPGGRPSGIGPLARSMVAANRMAAMPPRHPAGVQARAAPPPADPYMMGRDSAGGYRTQQPQQPQQPPAPGPLSAGVMRQSQGGFKPMPQAAAPPGAAGRWQQTGSRVSPLAAGLKAMRGPQQPGQRGVPDSMPGTAPASGPASQQVRSRAPSAAGSTMSVGSANKYYESWFNAQKQAQAQAEEARSLQPQRSAAGTPYQDVGEDSVRMQSSSPEWHNAQSEASLPHSQASREYQPRSTPPLGSSQRQQAAAVPEYQRPVSEATTYQDAQYTSPQPYSGRSSGMAASPGDPPSHRSSGYGSARESGWATGRESLSAGTSSGGAMATARESFALSSMAPSRHESFRQSTLRSAAAAEADAGDLQSRRTSGAATRGLAPDAAPPEAPRPASGASAARGPPPPPNWLLQSLPRNQQPPPVVPPALPQAAPPPELSSGAVPRSPPSAKQGPYTAQRPPASPGGRPAGYPSPQNYPGYPRAQPGAPASPAQTRALPPGAYPNSPGQQGFARRQPQASPGARQPGPGGPPMTGPPQGNLTLSDMQQQAAMQDLRMRKEHAGSASSSPYPGPGQPGTGSRTRRVSNDTEGGYGTDQSTPASSRRASGMNMRSPSMPQGYPGIPYGSPYQQQSPGILRQLESTPPPPSGAMMRPSNSQLKKAAAAAWQAAANTSPPPAGYGLSADIISQAAARLRNVPSSRGSTLPGSTMSSARGEDGMPPAAGAGYTPVGMQGVFDAIRTGQYQLRKTPSSGAGSSKGMSRAGSGRDMEPGMSVIAQKVAAMRRTQVAADDSDSGNEFE